MMTEYDFIHNEEGSGYHVEYLNSASLSYDWTEKLSTYYEVATLFGTQDPPWIPGLPISLDTTGHSTSAVTSASRALQIASMPLSGCRSAFKLGSKQREGQGEAVFAGVTLSAVNDVIAVRSRPSRMDTSWRTGGKAV